MKNRMSKNVFCLALIGFGIVSAGNAMASKVRIGGQLQLQAENHFDDADDRIGGKFRRIELVVKGSVTDDWSYQVDLEKNAGDSLYGSLGAMGASFIAYNGFEPIWLAGGHLSQPFGLENWGSSSSTTFVERNLTVFGEIGDYMTGVYAGGNTDTISYALSLGKSDRSTADGGDFTGSNSFELAKGHFNYTGRVAWSPKFGEGTAMDGVYHLSASYIGFKADESYDFTDSNIAAARKDSFGIWNISAAGIWGPIMFQAEYESTDDFNYVQDREVKSYYAQLSYVITGETRSYDTPSATVGRLTPASKNGAWEVAVGYNLFEDDSYTNEDMRASDGNNPRAGTTNKTKIWNLGVNWYWNKYVKMSATYQMQKDGFPDSGTTGTSNNSVQGDNNILFLRTQLRF